MYNCLFDIDVEHSQNLIDFPMFHCQTIPAYFIQICR